LIRAFSFQEKKIHILREEQQAKVMLQSRKSTLNKEFFGILQSELVADI